MTALDRRLGALVIHNDPVPEVELWGERPPDVTIHTARFDTPRDAGEEFLGRSVARLVEGTGLRRAAEHLADLGAHAIGYCFTSSSVFGGDGFDDELERALAAATDGVPAVTSGRALRDEVRARRGQRFLVVVPPWFSDATVDALVRYLDLAERRARILRYELDAAWSHIARPDLFDAGARHAVTAEALVEQVARACPDDVDAVLVPGGGMRSLDAQRVLRSRFGLPTVSANGALLRALVTEVEEGGRASARTVPDAARL